VQLLPKVSEIKVFSDVKILPKASDFKY
jgi:hypothetical protein